MKTEEIQKLFHELKNSFEAGAINEEAFQTEMEGLLFQDDAGNYWTIGARTEKWYRYEEGDWVQASPPPMLEPVAREARPPGMKQKPLPPSRKRGYGTPIVLGSVSFLFLLCLILVALVSYQLGRLSVMTSPAEYTPIVAIATKATTDAPAVEATLPSEVLTATPSPTEVEGMATPLPTAPQEASPTPTSTSIPSATRAPQPTATPMPTPDMNYGPPILMGPENGAQFGGRYDAILVWELVDELAEGEYYHVEVCWNGCDSSDDFYGDYVRDTETVFPSWIYSGRAIDDKYYWHVIVRAQRGETPAGPLDPPISPPSETWIFLLI